MKKFIYRYAALIGGILAQTSVASASSNEITYAYPAFDGLYVGAHTALGKHKVNRDCTIGFDNSANDTVTPVIPNLSAGARLGYDYQYGSIVTGVVADWSWHGDRRNYYGGGSGFHTKCDWVSTLRVRSGLAIGDYLAYATAGGALSRLNTLWWNVSDTGRGMYEYKKNQLGWVVGVGAEKNLLNGWSVGIECLYTQLGSRSKTISLSGATFKHRDSMWSGTVSLNYRLGESFL